MNGDLDTITSFLLFLTMISFVIGGFLCYKKSDHWGWFYLGGFILLLVTLGYRKGELEGKKKEADRVYNLIETFRKKKQP